MAYSDPLQRPGLTFEVTKLLFFARFNLPLQPHPYEGPQQRERIMGHLTAVLCWHKWTVTINVDLIIHMVNKLDDKETCLNLKLSLCSTDPRSSPGCSTFCLSSMRRHWVSLFLTSVPSLHPNGSFQAIPLQDATHCGLPLCSKFESIFTSLFIISTDL